MGKHILVVDDNEDAAEMLGELLQTEVPKRFTVQVVFSGEAALEAAKQHTPQTVVLDIEMPGINGFQVAQALRLTPATSTAHLIAVSGRSDHIDRVNARTTAFHHGMTKPLDFETLVALIDDGVSTS